MVADGMSLFSEEALLLEFVNIFVSRYNYYILNIEDNDSYMNITNLNTWPL